MEMNERELSLRMVDGEFQRDVLDKLARLETKMDGLVGDAQPGRMKMAEDKIAELEKNDVRRSVFDRMINATISIVVSALIAGHDRWKGF
jgi:hypothetical protein